jgi:Flp pilus assembly protein TadG
MRVRPRYCARRKGGAFVEFALSFSVLFALFAGLFQAGYTLFSYNTLVNGVREGARYASLRPYDGDESFTAAVRNMVVYGNPQPSKNAEPIIRGLTPENVLLNVIANQGVPTSVTVSVHNYPIHAIFATMVLDRRPSATFAYTGIVMPSVEIK